MIVQPSMQMHTMVNTFTRALASWAGFAVLHQAACYHHASCSKAAPLVIYHGVVLAHMPERNLQLVKAYTSSSYSNVTKPV
jgi:hypothetical protein